MLGSIGPAPKPVTGRTTRAPWAVRHGRPSVPPGDTRAAVDPNGPANGGCDGEPNPRDLGGRVRTPDPRTAGLVAGRGRIRDPHVPGALRSGLHVRRWTGRRLPVDPLGRPGPARPVAGERPSGHGHEILRAPAVLPVLREAGDRARTPARSHAVRPPVPRGARDMAGRTRGPARAGRDGRRRAPQSGSLNASLDRPKGRTVRRPGAGSP